MSASWARVPAALGIPTGGGCNSGEDALGDASTTIALEGEVSDTGSGLGAGVGAA